MKKTNKARNLRLTKETLATLSNEQLENAAGGTTGVYCKPPTELPHLSKTCGSYFGC